MFLLANIFYHYSAPLQSTVNHITYSDSREVQLFFAKSIASIANLSMSETGFFNLFMFLFFVAAETVREGECERTEIISGVHIKMLIGIIHLGLRNTRIE